MISEPTNIPTCQNDPSTSTLYLLNPLGLGHWFDPHPITVPTHSIKLIAYLSDAGVTYWNTIDQKNHTSNQTYHITPQKNVGLCLTHSLFDILSDLSILSYDDSPATTDEIVRLAALYSLGKKDLEVVDAVSPWVELWVLRMLHRDKDDDEGVEEAMEVLIEEERRREELVREIVAWEGVVGSFAGTFPWGDIL
jgi:hypothetical protein